MHEPDPATPGGADQGSIEQLLVECLDALTVRGPDAVAELLAPHPHLAAAVRERLGLLDHLGMLDVDRPPTGGFSHAPTQLGDFRILERIGAGGMGVVHLAEQVGLGRRVALKVLPHGAMSTETERERFRREARAIARLDHPNVVRVLATGEDQGLCWIAMEHVPGRGLDEVLRDAAVAGEPLQIAEVLGWGRAIASGLGAAHREGIVHRDVKPGNIRVTPDGVAKLLDFGLARIEDEERLTRSLGFRGSPYYAAPEQVREGGGEIGPGADVYSLGVTLYECLVGRVPFGGDTTEQVFHAILTAQPAPLARRGSPLPPDLDAVISKAIEKRPADRYADADAFADDLAAVLEYRSVTARRPGALKRARRWMQRHRRVAAGIAAVVLAVAVGLTMLALDARARAAAFRRDVESALASARQDIDALSGLRLRFGHLRGRQDELRDAIDKRQEIADWDAHYAELGAVEAELAVGVLRASNIEEQVREHLTVVSGHPDFVDEVRRAEVDLFVGVYQFLQGLDAGGADSGGASSWPRANPSFYRELADSRDQEGRYRDLLRPVYPLEIGGCPPGTELHLFAYRSLAELMPGGDVRQVPVPFRGQPDGAIDPGTHGLRVVDAAGGLEHGDFVYNVGGHSLEDVVFAVGPGERGIERLSRVDDRVVRAPVDVPDAEPPDGGVRSFVLVDGERTSRTVTARQLADLGLTLRSPAEVVRAGGVTVRLWRDGRGLELRVGPGARCLPTASPLLFGPTSVLSDPAPVLELAQGDYLVVARRDGCPDQHQVAKMVRPFGINMDVPAAVAAVSGFVFVQTHFWGELNRYWVQEREVSAAEYLRYLNDPQTLAEVDAAEVPIRVPREPGARGAELLWQRGADGYALPADWRGDWPAVGVSWDDAQAYVAWRNRVAGDDGVRFSLPTWSEWFHATVSHSVGAYPWGDVFRPAWTNSCYSRDRVTLEPAFSYPRDRTPLGIYDAAGSAFEWVDAWFSEARGERLRVGGSWEYPGAEFFRTNWWTGAVPEHADQSSGFRLVARIVE